MKMKSASLICLSVLSVFSLCGFGFGSSAQGAAPKICYATSLAEVQACQDGELLVFDPSREARLKGDMKGKSPAQIIAGFCNFDKEINTTGAFMCIVQKKPNTTELLSKKFTD